jgi:hypothetical protein
MLSDCSETERSPTWIDLVQDSDKLGQRPWLPNRLRDLSRMVVYVDHVQAIPASDSAFVRCMVGFLRDAIVQRTKRAMSGPVVDHENTSFGSSPSATAKSIMQFVQVTLAISVVTVCGRSGGFTSLS